MFGNKRYDGVGYPTPSSIPVDLAYRLAKIPADSSWLAVFMGMLEVGLSEENWQQFEGGISREDAVAVWQDIITEMYAFAEDPTLIQDVRQNPLLPCILEKTFDGSTWVQFADLQACPPILQNGVQGLNAGYKVGGDITYFRVPDGPWVSDPIDTVIDSVVPTGTQTTQTNNLCTAAANAANVLLKLGQGISESIVNSAFSQVVSVASSLDEFIELLLGVASIPVAIPVLIHFISVQIEFQQVNWTDPTFLRTLACIIRGRMTGTDGNWTIDRAGVLTDIAASSSLSVAQKARLVDEMGVIGANALNVAAKTTAIASYDCTTGANLFKLQDVNYDTQNGTGTSTSVYCFGPAPTGGIAAFVQLNCITVPATWSPQAAQNVPPGGTHIGSGPTSSSFGVGLYYYANANVYASDAAAKAAISAATGTPVGSINLLARSAWTNQPGNAGYWNYKLNTTGGRIRFFISSWYTLNLAGC